MENANLILKLQAVFVAGWTLVRFIRPDPGRHRLNPEPRFLFLVISWLASISLSLLMSPYGLNSETHAISRYLQTIMHVAFAWAVFDVMKRDQRSRILLPAILPGIMITILGYYLYAGFTDNLRVMHAERDWLHAPPLHAHIRHTGYMITAALSVSMAHFATSESRKVMAMQAGFMTLGWAFLFWCGGRASMLSSLLVMAGLLCLLKHQKAKPLKHAGCMMGAAFLGLLIAEYMAVFPWNGALQGIIRSIPDDMTINEINRTGSGRLLFWKTSLESLHGHVWFGLGPQGYFNMPNRVYGLHPHNVLIQFLVEWGVSGTLLFLALIYSLIVKGYTLVMRTNIDDYRVVAGAVIVVLTVNGLADGTWYHPQPSMYLALAFAAWTQGAGTTAGSTKTPSRDINVMDWHDARS